MENWDSQDVKEWLKEVVQFPDELVAIFDDVDGFTLINYTRDTLREDFNLSVGNCRKLLFRRQEHLDKEEKTSIMKLPTTTLTSPILEESHRLSATATTHQASNLKAQDVFVTSGDAPDLEYEETEKVLTTSYEKVYVPSLHADQDREPKSRIKVGSRGAHFTRDNEKKLTQLLIGSDKGELDSSFYPVLVASTPAHGLNSVKEIEEKLGFMASVNWNVVFDCNPDSNKEGLCNFVRERRRIKILSPRDFQTKDYDKQKDDIEFPDVPVWLFPNGRLDAEECQEEKLSNEAWMRDRSYAVSNTVRFFSDPEVIPPGRAIVVFFLLSEADIMVISQIFREFYTSESFQNLQHFTVIAEDERVMEKWIQCLESQQIVTSSDMIGRCLSGVPWQEINTNMLRLLGSRETQLPELPMPPKGACQLMKKHQSMWSDISVLARNECENTSMDEDNPNFIDFVRGKEAKFYQGHEVDWWNFYLSEDKFNKGKGYNHVLKRQSYENLSTIVKSVLKQQRKKTSHISMVTIFHEAGSGGTTVAKNILWDLHRQYRCAVVNRVTNDTVNQILALRRYSYDKPENPGPVVILLENLNSECMSMFLINLEREIKNMTDEGLAFVLLHCKRTNEPEKFHKEKNNPCVAVHHKLSPEERDWFRQKTEDLEERQVFSEKDSPELLLAFMVMKEECHPDYLKAVVRRILPDMSDRCPTEIKKAVKLLKYIAAVHKYYPGFAMPVSACDQYMQKLLPYSVSMGRHKKPRPWEKDRPKILKLLLIEQSITDIEGCVKGLGIAHHTLAAEILQQLGKLFNQTPSDIILEFLEQSTILDTTSHSKGYIKKICRYMMVHRMKKEDGDENENFSPLIEDVYKEDPTKAIRILKVGLEKFQDPIIAQQKARLHSYYEQDYEEAEESINIALELRGNNSYLWDTKGIILREKMVAMDQGHRELTDEDMKKLFQAFEDACSAFKNSQAANDEDATDHNNGGYLGEIMTIFKFLGIIQKRFGVFFAEDGQEQMRKYLVTDYIPESLNLPSLQYQHKTLKILHERVETVLGCVTDFMAQCAKRRFSSSQNTIIERKLEKIYNIREQFFGLRYKEIADLWSESVKTTTAYAMRRARVMRMKADGYQRIFELASKKKVDELKRVQSLLKYNMKNPNLFDVRNTVLISFALAVCDDDGFNEDEVRKYVEILKDFEAKSKGFYGLFFEMMLNWPDRLLKREIPPIQDTVAELESRWKRKYNHVHDQPGLHLGEKRSRVRQHVNTIKASTDFYLGRQGSRRLIHKNMIGKMTFGTWKEEAITRRMARLEGVLHNKLFLMYKPPRGDPLKIRLSLPIQGLPSQEPVTFYLGFSFSGPLAYNVGYIDRQAQFTSRETQFSLPAYLETEGLSADVSLGILP